MAVDVAAVAATADLHLLAAAPAVENPEALLWHDTRAAEAFWTRASWRAFATSTLLSGNDTRKARAATRAFVLSAALIRLPTNSATGQTPDRHAALANDPVDHAGEQFWGHPAIFTGIARISGPIDNG